MSDKQQPSSPRHALQRSLSNRTFTNPTMIFVTAAKFSTDSILNASMELRRRGFIVEIEKEDKDSTKCYFLLSLTPSLIQSISFAKDLPVFKHLGNYSAIQQLIILNSAVDIIMESCTFLEGRDAWVVQEKQKYDSIFKEVKQTDKLLGINNYFGPQIALYFGWLNHYTELLLFPSLFGVLTFAHQYYSGSVDSAWMPFYAVFMAIWTTIFLELSKRQCSTFAFHWGVLGIEDDMTAKDVSKGAVNESPNKGWKLFISFCATIILMYFMVEIMLYAVDAQLRAEDIYGKDSWKKYMPAVLYSLLPIVSSSVFQPIAEFLTKYETHSTKIEFEKYYILKQFSLQFVNRYCGLLYIAFWLRDLDMLRSLLISLLVTGQIVNNFMELGIPKLISLYQHYILRKVLNLTDFFFCFFSHPFMQKSNSSTESSANNNAANDLKEKFELVENELSASDYDLNDDYLEMALQFGYVTMFAPVFPLAPILAFINNYFEPSIDLAKLGLCKRARVKLCSNIGAWQTCFEFLAVVAVITNCYLLAMVSTKLEVIIPSELKLPLHTEYGRVLAMLILEHILLGFKIVLSSIIDDVPREIREQMALSKLEETKENKEKRLDMFVKEEKSKAYESLLNVAQYDPSASAIPFKEAVLSHDRKLHENRMMKEQETKQAPSGSKNEVTSKLMDLLNQNKFGFDPFSLTAIIFIPILCQYFNVSSLLYIPVAILFLAYFQSIKNRIDRQIAVGIVTDAKLLKFIHEELPSWFYDAEFQRVEWLNSILGKLFPQLAHGIEILAKEKVQPILDANTPFYLPKLLLEDANLGSISPKITGVRVYNTTESNIRFDLEIKWAGDTQVTLKLCTPPLPISVELTNLRFTANLRVELLDLHGKLPCFKAVSVTCMKKPSLEFSLKIASLDIMSVGATSDYNVTSIVKTIIDNVVSSVALYPKKFVIPMNDNVNADKYANETPDGILILFLVKGTDLLSVNLMGGSDPFVEFSSSSDLKHRPRSSTKHGSVNPEWNETFQFFVYDKSTDVIHLTVYDADFTNQMNTFMGRASLHLDTIKRNSDKPQEITLQLRDVDKGSLRISVVYRSIKKKKISFAKTGDDVGIEDNIVYHDLDESELVNNDKLVEEREKAFEESAELGEEDDAFDSHNLLSFSVPKQSSRSQRNLSMDEQSMMSNLTSSSVNSSSKLGKRASLTRAVSSMKKMEDFNESITSMVGILNISKIKLVNIKLQDGSMFSMDSTLRLYVSFTVGNKRMETKYIKNNHNPTFIENFTFLINSLNEELVVHVYNKVKYSVSSTKPLGSVVIPLKDITSANRDGEDTQQKKTQSSGIEKVEQQYMLNGLKEEGFVSFKAVLSVFER